MPKGWLSSVIPARGALFGAVRKEMSENNTERTSLARLLAERGVGGAAVIVDQEFGDHELAGAHATVRWYDDQPPGKVTAALLLWALRSRSQVGYRRPHEREAGGAGEITPRLLRSIRAGCSTPDGITREEARWLYEPKANSLGIPVDELIDMAMDPSWTETRPHPGKDPDNPNKARDYECWVAGA